MSFGDHAILWLHVTAAIFTIGPGTAAIMSTPRYIRKRNPVMVGYLLRTTRIYSFGSPAHPGLWPHPHRDDAQIQPMVDLRIADAFVVAFVLLRSSFAISEGPQALDSAAGAAVADGVEDSIRPWIAAEAVPRGRRGEPAAQPAATRTRRAGPPPTTSVAAVERGRIASLGGVTALIWLVILVFMVWH